MSSGIFNRVWNKYFGERGIIHYKTSWIKTIAILLTLNLAYKINFIFCKKITFNPTAYCFYNRIRLSIRKKKKCRLARFWLPLFDIFTSHYRKLLVSPTVGTCECLVENRSAGSRRTVGNILIKKKTKNWDT